MLNSKRSNTKEFANDLKSVPVISSNIEEKLKNIDTSKKKKTGGKKKKTIGVNVKLDAPSSICETESQSSEFLQIDAVDGNLDMMDFIESDKNFSDCIDFNSNYNYKIIHTPLKEDTIRTLWNKPKHIFKGEEHKDISKMKMTDVKTVFSHYVENGVMRLLSKPKIILLVFIFQWIHVILCFFITNYGTIYSWI